MIGIRGHLLRQAMLLRRETLNRFENGLIRGFDFHSDCFRLALDLRTNDFGAQFCIKRGLPRFLRPEGCEV